MNETRKKINELIEPYMDKSLDFWCLILWLSPNIFDIIMWQSETDYKTELWFLDVKLNKWDYKIIWHYDITAVLKYIYNHWYEEWETFIWKNNFHFIDLWNVRIPNKPLHLYTEEQEKSLLQILLKLNEQ